MAVVYARDGGYRIFGRISSPNLDVDSYTESCPCRLRDEHHWEVRLQSQDNWVYRVEPGWHMEFGGNTNFDLSITCASSLVDNYSNNLRRKDTNISFFVFII